MNDNTLYFLDQKNSEITIIINELEYTKDLNKNVLDREILINERKRCRCCGVYLTKYQDVWCSRNCEIFLCN